MKTSIIKNKNLIISFIFWLIVLEVLSLISNSYFFPRPTKVILYSLTKLGDLNYYLVSINSFLRIFLGFLLALISGSFLAILSYRYKLVKDLLTFPMLVFKTVPVASFIILVLLFFDSKLLSIIISFIMSISLIYTSILTSLEEVSSELKEMAKVFKVKTAKQIKYLYLPKIFNTSLASSILALQMAVKSGIAAELIGLPNNTLGELLYEAKLYLDIYDLFHVTVLLVIFSIVLVKFYEKLIKYLYKRLLWQTL